MGAAHDHKRDVGHASASAERAEQVEQRPERIAAGLVPVTGLAVSADPLGGTAVDKDTARRLANPTGGRPLDRSIRARMERALDADFSAVRVHDDSAAADLATGVASRAFTHGRDIYFSRGAFDTGSAAGQHTLAHELTHVAQQQQGRDRGGNQLTIGRADDPLEAEADQVASRVVRTLRERGEKRGEPA